MPRRREDQLDLLDLIEHCANNPVTHEERMRLARMSKRLGVKPLSLIQNYSKKERMEMMRKRMAEEDGSIKEKLSNRRLQMQQARARYSERRQSGTHPKPSN